MIKNKIILLIFILFISSFIYFFKLESYPPSVHCDEIYVAEYGHKIISGGLKNLIGVSWWDIPNAAFFPQGVSSMIIGKRILTPRLPAPIFSVLTLIVVFFLVRRIFNTRTAYISIILLSTSHWWISISRAGYSNALTALLQVLTYYFIFVSFDKNKKNFMYPILAGIFLSLGNYIYINFRVVVFIILTVFAHKFLISSDKEESKLTLIKNVILLFLTAALFFTPMFLFYFKNPQTILSRTSTSFIFSKTIKEHMYSVYGTYDKKTWLIGNIKKAFDISDKNFDSGLQYGYRGRLLDLITLVFFIIGLIISLKNIKQVRYFFLLSWFWLSYLLLAILTEGVIRNYRIIGIYPVVYIYTALAMDQIIQFLELKLAKNHLQKNIVYLVFAILIAIIIAINLKIYFYDNQKNKIYTFTKIPEMKLNDYFQTLDHNNQLVFISQPYIYPNWCLFWYLTPYLRTYSVNSDQPIPKYSGKLIFIIHKTYQDRLNEIILSYPNGEIINNFDDNLIIYKVNN
ncbi:MAG: hypothetical protein ACD_12C00758G0002 [uncultured bacterium]|nr:MAG: hypothetical protein ACD_12C00758G0002 [uncultured bacterium]